MKLKLHPPSTGGLSNTIESYPSSGAKAQTESIILDGEESGNIKIAFTEGRYDFKELQEGPIFVEGGHIALAGAVNIIGNPGKFTGELNLDIGLVDSAVACSFLENLVRSGDVG